jgi:hypothetical protein
MSSSNELDFAKFTKEEVTQVFGPGSDSRKAYELSKRQPNLYAAMKQAAVYNFGLLPEAMLPRASQLTRDQLELKRRADLAAQKDELIEVPMPVCDRLGLPHGTRVTWDKLQKSMGRQPV